LFSVLVIAVMVLAACAKPTPAATEPVSINLWTKEGEADGGFTVCSGIN
jgi:hypothetical protein